VVLEKLAKSAQQPPSPEVESRVGYKKNVYNISFGRTFISWWNLLFRTIRLFSYTMCCH